MWFNDQTCEPRVHEAFKALPRTNVKATYAVGQAVGSPVVSLVAKQMNYDWTRPADGSLTGNVAFQGSLGVSIEWGCALTAGKATVSCSGNTTSKDDGAATCSGLAGVLHIVDVCTDTVTITLQDSTDGCCFCTLIAFTVKQCNSTPSAERKTVAGLVNRHLRLNAAGCFTNADIMFSYRRGVVQDDQAYT